MRRLTDQDFADSVVQRHLTAMTTFHMAADRPLFGWGSGSFRFVFPLYQQKVPQIFLQDGVRLYWEHAHCDYAEIFAELGVIGLIPVAVGVCFWIIGMIRSNFWGNPLGIFLFLGLALTTIHSTFDFNFYNPAILLTWFALCPIALKWVQFEAEAHSNLM
jgi:O-antigen ligase